MTVLVLSKDLIVASRILDAAARAGRETILIDHPRRLPARDEVAIVFVNWADRDDDWADELARWRAAPPTSETPRLVLFGPHVDLGAHAAARAAGLGPMRARSSLLGDLERLLEHP